MAAAGLLVGVALFPVGRVTTLSGDTLPLASGMVRIAAAALIVGLSLLGLAAIGLFISTMTDVAVGAMAVTLGLLILSAVLDAIPQVAGIHPWLLTHDWLTFGDLLRTPIQWDGIRATSVASWPTSPCSGRWPGPASPPRTSWPEARAAP